MNSAKYLMDSGPLIAALNRRDLHHEWAVGMMAKLEEAPITCEAVITEVCWHLRRSTAAVARVLTMPMQGDLILNAIIGTDGPLIAARITKYGESMDLADACLVRMAEIYPRAKIITIDREHFTVYRRNRNHALALICP